MEERRAVGRGDGGVIGALDNPGAEKQTLDIVAFIKLHRQVNNLINRKSGSRDIAGAAIYTVGALVQTKIGQQDF